MSDQMSEDLSSVCDLSSDELSFLMDVCNIAKDDPNCQILVNEISSWSQQQCDLFQHHSDIDGFKVTSDDLFVNNDVENNAEFDFNFSDLKFDEHYERTIEDGRSIVFQANQSDSDAEKSNNYDSLVWKSQVSHENYSRSDQFPSLTLTDHLEPNNDQENQLPVPDSLYVLSDQETQTCNTLQTFEDSTFPEMNFLSDDQLSVVLGQSGCVVQMYNLTGTSLNVQESLTTSQIMPASVTSPSDSDFSSSGKFKVVTL